VARVELGEFLHVADDGGELGGHSADLVGGKLQPGQPRDVVNVGCADELVALGRRRHDGLLIPQRAVSSPDRDVPGGDGTEGTNSAVPGPACSAEEQGRARTPDRLTSMGYDFLGIVGTTVGDKYLVEEAVGEGSFSVVYRAMHRVWQLPVALKCFKGF